MAAGKVVVSAVSIILVVGVVIGVVAVVHRGGGDDKKNDVDLSTSIKKVDALCAPALFKDNCKKSLNSVVKNDSATPEDYVKAGAKLAMEQLIKVFNLTDTVTPKVAKTNNPNMTKMALDDCQDLLDAAIMQLQETMNEIGNPEVYQDEEKRWEMRLWLSDIITYQSDCMDGLDQAKAHDIKDIMKDGMVDASEVTMSILDIITFFVNSLGKMGFDVNAEKITDMLTGEDTDEVVEGDGTSSASARRLLSMNDMNANAYPLDEEDGLPYWMAPEDRKVLLESEAQPAAGGITPNVVVASDGSGQYKSIQAAVDAFDDKKWNGPGRYKIYIKAGVYKEQILIKKKKKGLYMYGDGPGQTIITGDSSFAKGVGTSKTATFASEINDFFCRGITFENTAGPEGHQAVAVRVKGERVIFHHCHFLAFQDTLYPQAGSNFFRGCTVAGTVDFIFGNAATILQKCRLALRKPMENQFNALHASGRDGPSMPTAIVIHDCDIIPGKGLDQSTKSYLGRPWKKYAKAVVMQSRICEYITPEGYKQWEDENHNPINWDTAEYLEYGNTGPGANTNKRAKWPKVQVIDRNRAQGFTMKNFLVGSQAWVGMTGIPYNLYLS